MPSSRPQVAVLSGCSSGIGLGVARHLLRTTPLSLVCLSRNPGQTLARLREGSSGPDDVGIRVRSFEVDAMSDEVDDQLRAASQAAEAEWGKGSVRLVSCFNGILHPEKSVSQITSQTALSSFRVNTLSHLLTYAHFTPLIPSAASLKRDQPPETGLLDGDLSLCMSLTARVASIGDNRLGGWTSYRATKAGTNAAVKNLQLELALRKSSAIAVAYHPGTVKTGLSAPFVAADKQEGDAHGLFDVDAAVRKWEAVVKGLRREDGGGFRDWKGDHIEW